MKPTTKKPEPNPYTEPYLPGLEIIAPFVDHTDDGKSNTVELFDALVIYSMDHARDNARFLDATKVFRGRTYNVRVTPAAVPRDGKPAMVLPGLRESLVEKALRKIASEDLDNIGATQKESNGSAEVWVKFSLYQLRKTLAEQGHHFTIAQLEEAINVLQGARLTVTGDLGEYIDGANTNFLQSVVWRKKKTGDEEGREFKICAKLHPYITHSILARTFRQIDFAKLMRPKNDLAQWIYIRLSHNYTQASDSDYIKFKMQDKNAGYHLALSTIIRETGCSFATTSKAVRAVRAALTVLSKQDVLMSKDWTGRPFQGWEEIVQYDDSNGGRRPIKDVIFHLFPSMAVVDDIVKANQKSRELQKLR